MPAVERSEPLAESSKGIEGELPAGTPFEATSTGPQSLLMATAGEILVQEGTREATVEAIIADVLESDRESDRNALWSPRPPSMADSKSPSVLGLSGVRGALYCRQSELASFDWPETNRARHEIKM